MVCLCMRNAYAVKETLKTKFFWFGIIGSIILLIGLIIPQFFYTGRQSERYSMINHFVSELGELGVSEGAIIFNVCTFIGGILFIPFMIGLGQYMENKIGIIGAIIGIITAIGCALVGIFPMNSETLTNHAIAALTFFQGSILTTLVFTLSILIQKEIKIPKLYSIGGFI
ncbi:MAG: DUF998 domain-containing protein, partial [Candidatus Lokiarchaeota archaeon]|nr:DUF998 domain-containing protein [Candidatus Lokiarchaeota archaeon]